MKKTVPGPLGLFCAVLLVSALTLSVRSSTGYSQYDTAPGGGSNTIPIVTAYNDDGALATGQPARDSGAASRLVVHVKKGDTLMDILTKSGVPVGEAEEAITSLREVYNPRKLRSGQKVTLLFAPDATLAPAAGSRPPPAATDDSSTLLGVKIRPEVGREVAANRSPSGAFSATAVERKLEPLTLRSGGVIHTSLFDAAEAANLPSKVLAEMIHAFSYDVDFQRDIQPGDSFEVLYEQLADDEGHRIDTGKVDYAELVLSGHHLALYHYTTKDGDTDYFNKKGESVRKALLRTPIDGARLSSGFGKRKHPILGYTRMHKGVDFAAPKGTPIYAAGKGVVLSARRHGGYGNYIEIRHNAEFHTGYGHLSRFAKGIHAGTRVTQGEVIGYVGATGLATGPHLHYEVIRDHKKVNPLSVNLPSGRKLRGKELDQFLVARAKVDTLMAQLPIESTVASSQ